MNIITLFIGLQIGIVVGGLMFDMFISRPTLRILNEELKRYQNLLEQAMETLKQEKFNNANMRRIKQNNE